MGMLRQLAFVDPSNIPIEMFEDLRQHLPILKSHCLVFVPKSSGPQVVSIHSLTQEVIRERLMGNARAQVLQTVMASLARQMDTFDQYKPETYMLCLQHVLGVCAACAGAPGARGPYGHRV